METAISEVPTSRRAVDPAANQGLQGVGANDFMTLLIKQLQFQDPFEPMGNEEMLAQMSTIRELEMTTRLSDKLEMLTDQQRFASVTALMGKYVQGDVSDEDGNTFPVEGVVNAIRFTAQGNVMLELDSGEALPLTGLQKVTGPESQA